MTKYIDRELALSLPFANGRYDEENGNINFICGCETYKEYLEGIPYFEVRGWIPCSERLPENVLDVLISDNIGHVEVGCYINGKWYDYNVDEYGEQDENFNLKVLAWQPLPKAYKPSLWDKFKDKKHDIDSKYGEQVIDEKTVEQIERECGINKNYGFGSKEEADLWMNSKPVGKEEI